MKSKGQEYENFSNNLVVNRIKEFACISGDFSRFTITVLDLIYEHSNDFEEVRKLVNSFQPPVTSAEFTDFTCPSSYFRFDMCRKGRKI